MGTSLQEIHARLVLEVPGYRRSELHSPEPETMESQIQAQIPGIDHVVSEYAVVCICMREGKCE
jgi:hypothetical protein